MGFRRRVLRLFLTGMLVWPVLAFTVPLFVPPPAAVARDVPPRPAMQLAYLHDDSWLDRAGERRLSQDIFDRVFEIISRAEQFVLIDMFLFNDWQGPDPERHRALADELSNALVARREERPDLHAVLITDPINTVYGGLPSARLQRLRDAGVDVVLTDLTQLQDSNPLWSGLWRWLIRPFGNSPNGSLPNPFGAGDVTLRSWLALINFKANHRKLIVGDDGSGLLTALVTSANPHDGSSAHRNTALAFGGPAASDILNAEIALLELSGAAETAVRLRRHATGIEADRPQSRDTRSNGTVQVVSESRIEEAAIEMLARARTGSQVDLSMFYLSDRELVAALKSAVARGALVRVLLDVNRDAFGRAKNGVPNRPVAAELMAAGVQVRWCETSGEQCHAKQLVVDQGDTLSLLLGSGNWTRRNLHDLNLETDVRVELAGDHPLAFELREHFSHLWNNTAERTYSADYEHYADDGVWLRFQYRFMEMTGLSTF